MNTVLKTKGSDDRRTGIERGSLGGRTVARRTRAAAAIDIRKGHTSMEQHHNHPTFSLNLGGIVVTGEVNGKVRLHMPNGDREFSFDDVVHEDIRVTKSIRLRTRKSAETAPFSITLGRFHGKGDEKLVKCGQNVVVHHDGSIEHGHFSHHEWHADDAHLGN